MINRRGVLATLAGSTAWLGLGLGPVQRVWAEGAVEPGVAMLRDWYKLTLELVRHTATYTPPVASRAFAYLGIIAYEVMVQDGPVLRSFGGQLNEFKVPERVAMAHHTPLALHFAMTKAVMYFFGNTGPTGQRAMKAMSEDHLAGVMGANPAADLVETSRLRGEAIADHVIAWSETDGGAKIENMGFPMEFALQEGPAYWVPTNLLVQQQKPLLPDWGKNRTFAIPGGTTCGLPPPLTYSEDPESAFYKEAQEVYETVKNLTKEQTAIARFWSDDPMLSSTPPGHWITVALHLLELENADATRFAEVMALLGIAVADAFIACWAVKYQYNLLRPITYIRRVIDPKWEPLLNTPPFPEYPSGHSAQSGAAEVVLGQLFGTDLAFEDTAHTDDGLPGRTFPNFHAAAEEAGISRLYGGIHFRTAVAQGLEQGRCTGAYVNTLQTRA